MTNQPNHYNEMLIDTIVEKISQASLGTTKKFAFCFLVNQPGIDEPGELDIEVVRSRYNHSQFLVSILGMQMPMPVTFDQLKVTMRTVMEKADIVGFACDDPWYRILDRSPEDTVEDPHFSRPEETSTFQTLKVVDGKQRR